MYMSACVCLHIKKPARCCPVWLVSAPVSKWPERKRERRAVRRRLVGVLVQEEIGEGQDGEESCERRVVVEGKPGT